MPRITTHPGEVLREEFLLPMGLTSNALSIALRVPATRIGAIISEERAVTADTALRLSRYFGTTAGFWMNLQAAYDLSAAEAKVGAEISHFQIIERLCHKIEYSERWANITSSLPAWMKLGSGPFTRLDVV